MLSKKNKILIDTFLIVFGAYALLALASFDVGILGELIKNKFLYIFGIGAYIIPFYLFYLGYEVSIYQHPGRFRSWSRITGITLWFLIFLTVSQWQASHSGFTLKSGDFGGWVGMTLYGFFNYYLGSSGLFLVLFLFSFVSTFIIGEGRWIRYFLSLVKQCKKIFPWYTTADKLQEGWTPPVRKETKTVMTKAITVLKSKPSTAPTPIKMDTLSPMSQKVGDDIFHLEEFDIEPPAEPLPTVVAPPAPEKSGVSIHKMKQRRGAEWSLPNLSILNDYPSRGERVSRDEITAGIKKLEQTFLEFNVPGKVVNVRIGPTITRYEFQPAPGIKVNKIVALSNDIALAFAAAAVRIEAPIPGRSAVGIEIPNENKEIVSLKDLLETTHFMKDASPLSIVIGKDVIGRPLVCDLRDMPHLLIAGATGSGKSVCINVILASLLYKADPNQVRIAMVDPKRVELSVYTDLPHLCVPVISDVRWVVKFLKWLCREMDTRYKMLSDLSTRNIEEYNKMVEEYERLPYVVVIIDELADLMMTAPSDVESYICRLAQMARAVGIHLVVATQRPSVDVITGLIKANFPSRISFAVSSQADSKTILDGSGAEKLLGNGDMLFSPVGVNKSIRGQGAYISTAETKKIVEHWLNQSGEIFYSMDFVMKENVAESAEEDEELYREAVSVVIENGKASTSLIQRRLRIGFNRAARLIERMEREGLVGPYEGSKPRKVIANRGDDIS